MTLEKSFFPCGALGPPAALLSLVGLVLFSCASPTPRAVKKAPASLVHAVEGHSEALAIDNGDVFGYGAAFKEELKHVGQISPQEFQQNYAPSTNYLPGVSRDVTKASFYGEFEKAGLAPNDEEMLFFRKNGFVVSERLGKWSFVQVYYEIFKADLPVFITADSILHAWHRSYVAMLEELERLFFRETLREVLDGMAAAIPEAHASYRDAHFRASVEDADYFLAVARSLLSGKQVRTKRQTRDADVKRTLEAVSEGAALKLRLFGRARQIDFSKFKPRGHYADGGLLERYFQTIVWLGRIEMRVSGGEKRGETRELLSAIVLRDLLSRAGKVDTWSGLDSMLQTFVGRSDSMNFEQLGFLLEASSLTDPSTLTLSDLSSLQEDIALGSLGASEIRRNDTARLPLGPKAASVPRNFTVMGQRLAIDAWAISKLSGDEVVWNRKPVQRRMISALDVAFAVFGNSSVVSQIAARIVDPEGVRFRDGLPYQHNLAAARRVIDRQAEDSFGASIYESWIATLRELSEPMTSAEYPEAMRTEAWAMKDVNTQLGSWAQLRHDTIGYVKEYSGNPECFYPAGFVEPRPRFWKRFAQMARATERILSEATYSTSGNYQRAQKYHVRHFANFASKLELLAEIAQKQFSKEPLTKVEEKMLQEVVEVNPSCDPRERYTGWYPGLFYAGRADSDSWDNIVTDVHTNPPNKQVADLGGVLHQGVAGADFLTVAVDSGKDHMVYAGPTMSHYEFITDAGKRMTDAEWERILRAKKQPERPEWTRGYLVPITKDE